MQQELAFTAMCARVLCERAAARREGTATHGSDLTSNLLAVRAEHERLWKHRSRPGGMAKSSAHYTRLIDEFGAGTRG